MKNIIKVSHFQKNYNLIKAVQDISFEVEEGSLFAFLGPNGAGKSTTINTLCTLLKGDGGNIEINGHVLGKEDNQIKSDIGIVFQESLLDDQLTVEENLLVRGNLYSMHGVQLKKRVEEVLETTGIKEYKKQLYGLLSGGQRRRADIARALINTPKILFLDEPTTGLDPKTRLAIWSLIKEMQREMGMTIFLTTHYMEEAAEADRVVIINKGLIIEDATPIDLKNRYTQDRVLLYNVKPEIYEYLAHKRICYELNSEGMSIPIKDKEEAINLIYELKDLYGFFEVRKGTMDDMFLNVLKEEV